ncbi:hypothetical protein N172_17250 [Pantoea dispersa EGD-AAK13]|nr:hypothetical protein N172_17250 [Pantoea dispersa EGD-AAK13]
MGGDFYEAARRFLWQKCAKSNIYWFISLFIVIKL